MYAASITQTSIKIQNIAIIQESASSSFAMKSDPYRPRGNHCKW